MKAAPNGLTFTRYGLSVGKRIGNAVTRNRVKRLLRENIRLIEIKSGWDIVFIARNPAPDSDYYSIGDAVSNLLYHAHLMAEKCPGEMA